MKRTLLLVTLLVALPLLAQSDPAAARYHVELELYPGDDPAVIARQLAATYRAELDSSEPGPTPVLVMSETAAALLRDNPHVLRVTRLDQPPIRTPESHSSATWSTGAYGYDGAGNIKKIGTAETFVYDAFGRLTSGTTRNSGSQAYTYDAYGNLLTITTNDDTAHPVRLGVDPATNRITNGSGTNNAFAWYDGAGNVTATSAGDTFAWDGLGMLKESTVAGQRTLYLYTPDDERIASVRVATNGAVLSTDWTLRDTGGKVLRRYLELPGEQWSWVQDYIYRDGQLIATERAATPRRLHFFPDHLGTPRLITGTGGAQVSRHDYYPFGQEGTAWTDGERMKFTGHERDHATLDYMHARSYMTVWGRFLSVDPVTGSPAQPQTWNRYSYVTNRPILLMDPTGLVETAFHCNEAGDSCYYETTQSALRYTWMDELGDAGRGSLQTIDWLGMKLVEVTGFGNVLVGLYNDNWRQIAAGYGQQLAWAGPSAVYAGTRPLTGGVNLISVSAASSDEAVLVIGKLADTRILANTPGHEVIAAHNWTLARNDAWIAQAVAARRTFYMASNATPANVTHPLYGLSVYGRELAYLMRAGYTRSGMYLVPPLP